MVIISGCELYYSQLISSFELFAFICGIYSVGAHRIAACNGTVHGPDFICDDRNPPASIHRHVEGGGRIQKAEE